MPHVEDYDSYMQTVVEADGNSDIAVAEGSHGLCTTSTFTWMPWSSYPLWWPQRPNGDFMCASSTRCTGQPACGGGDRYGYTCNARQSDWTESTGFHKLCYCSLPSPPPPPPQEPPPSLPPLPSPTSPTSPAAVFAPCQCAWIDGQQRCVCTKEDQPLDDYVMERFRLHFARRYTHDEL